MVAYDFNPTLKARSDGLFKMQRDGEFSNWPLLCAQFRIKSWPTLLYFIQQNYACLNEP